MSQPKFTGVWIPTEVLSMPLTVSAKIVYGILAGLDNEDGCYASNGYIAAAVGCSDRQVRNIIAELEDAKLIIRGSTDGMRIIRTIEKDALCKVVGAEKDFLPRRKRTSARGGNRVPTDSIGNNIEDKGMVQLPFYSESFKNTWNKYCNHRRQLKRPISKVSIQSMFEQFKLWGEDASTAALIQSVTRGWIGVFPALPKGGFGGHNKPTLTQNDHKDF